MNSVKLAFIFLFTILNLLIIDVHAQRNYKGTYHRGKSQPNISLRKISKNELITLTGTTGYATYYGDLCNGIQCFKFRPQLGLSALLRTNYLGNRLNLRTDVRYFRLSSDDYYKHRNLDFRSSNWEALGLLQFDFFPYQKLMRRRPRLNPYIYAGFGVMTFNSQGKTPDGSKWIPLRPLETEQVKYSNTAFVYTAGFGLKIRYTYKWSFLVEGGYRYSNTDHIDDVSAQHYSSLGSFPGGANSMSAQMSNKTINPRQDVPQDYRGNPKNNDGYFIFSVGVSYTFTKNNNPKFKGDQQLLRKN